MCASSFEADRFLHLLHLAIRYYRQPFQLLDQFLVMIQVYLLLELMLQFGFSSPILHRISIIRQRFADC